MKKYFAMAIAALALAACDNNNDDFTVDNLKDTPIAIAKIFVFIFVCFYNYYSVLLFLQCRVIVSCDILPRAILLIGIEQLSHCG